MCREEDPRLVGALALVRGVTRPRREGVGKVMKEEGA